jgi:thiosulfate dehydrogenase [quinone] large subunit
MNDTAAIFTEDLLHLGPHRRRDHDYGIVTSVAETPEARASHGWRRDLPPRGWLISGWATLTLRAFLAFTFVFAGLQKLANPAFFSATSPVGLHQLMIGYVRSGSPIAGILRPLERFSTPVGIVIAFGELAVGIGMALGLWTRIAALGGLLISLSLFLAVSFNYSPWYTGADIVFLFAFTPFLVAGSGGVLSLDALIARRVATEGHLDDPTVVVLTFGQVQRSCGSYDAGRCLAVEGRICAPEGCPWLEGIRPALPTRRTRDEFDRRAVVLGSVAAIGAATIGALVGGADAGIGRSLAGAQGPSTQHALPPPPTTTGAGGGTGDLGTLIGTAADVPVGTSGTFTVPNGSGDPGLVIQERPDEFVAYDAVCPHEGCIVGYQPSANLIVCPCHGSEFNVADGACISGPAYPKGLKPLSISDDDGKLYVKA